MIAIVDYKAGNLTSVYRALNAVGVESEITADPDAVRAAERVIFPGVGAAGATMSVLTETGLGRAIADVAEQGKPLLGICIACQVILEHSEENDADCLGLLPGQVKAFAQDMIDKNARPTQVAPHGLERGRVRQGSFPVQRRRPRFGVLLCAQLLPRPVQRG